MDPMYPTILFYETKYDKVRMPISNFVLKIKLQVPVTTFGECKFSKTRIVEKS